MAQFDEYHGTKGFQVILFVSDHFFKVRFQVNLFCFQDAGRHDAHANGDIEFLWLRAAYS